MDELSPIFVPWADLSPLALRGVVEAFVLGEGTEYGLEEVSLDQKVAVVMEQLKTGTAQIVFHPQSESCTIVRVR